MIMYLWVNTYWLPAMAIIGGLVSLIWIAGKIADFVEHATTFFKHGDDEK